VLEELAGRDHALEPVAIDEEVVAAVLLGGALGPRGVQDGEAQARLALHQRAHKRSLAGARRRGDHEEPPAAAWRVTQGSLPVRKRWSSGAHDNGWPRTPRPETKTPARRPGFRGRPAWPRSGGLATAPQGEAREADAEQREGARFGDVGAERVVVALEGVISAGQAHRVEQK